MFHNSRAPTYKFIYLFIFIIFHSTNFGIYKQGAMQGGLGGQGTGAARGADDEAPARRRLAPARSEHGEREWGRESARREREREHMQGREGLGVGFYREEEGEGEAPRGGTAGDFNHHWWCRLMGELVGDEEEK
jgi:hypothetical protein